MYRNKEEKLFENCSLADDKMWASYMLHFCDALSITINVLLVTKYLTKLIYFEDLLLRNLNLHVKTSKTVVIKHTVAFSNHQGTNMSCSSYMGTINSTVKGQSSKLYTQRVKKLSGDREAHMVIVWDACLLESILESGYSEVFPNSRAKYVIFFVSNGHDGFPAIPLILWNSFKVLNAVIQMPCAQDPLAVYRYDPFYKVMRKNTLWDILNDSLALMNTLEDFNGISLEVSWFARTPTFVETLPKRMRENFVYRNVNYAGLDGSLLDSMEKYLNFKSEFVDPGVYRYGKVEENGTVSGSLGDVVYRKAEISINGRFVDDYRTEEIEFTEPVASDFSCVIVPKSKKIPHWIMLFNCFSLQSWLGMLAIFILFNILWYAFNANVDQYDVRLLLNITAIFLQTATKLHAQTHSQRILIVMALLFGVIIVGGIFSGSLVTSYSTVSFYPDIKTLKQLDESGLHISTTLKFFSNFESETMKSLARKTVAFYSNETALSRAARLRDTSGIERKEDAKYYIKTYYTGSDGFPLLHIVEECPISFFLAYVVYKGSPYLPRFNSAIRLFTESGFIYKWYSDAVDAFATANKSSGCNHQTLREINLMDIQAAIFFLVAGLILACCLFVIEISILRFNKKTP